MKILIYSDLHLEFGNNFRLPNNDADLLILAGDIITFKNIEPLTKFLSNWTKPVLYVAGNHEYYTGKPLDIGEDYFQQYIKENHPNLIWLRNTSVTVDDIEFFGGTMWTDFNKEDPSSIITAQSLLNDYRYILTPEGRRLTPYNSIVKHKEFKEKLLSWFKQDLQSKRVVISHHAPVINPNSVHKGSKLEPAFNSLDMLPIIEEYQPDLWVYGHTHESDDQKVKNSRIVANQFGYSTIKDSICKKFDPKGCEIIL